MTQTWTNYVWQWAREDRLMFLVFIVVCILSPFAYSVGVVYRWLKRLIDSGGDSVE